MSNVKRTDPTRELAEGSKKVLEKAGKLRKEADSLFQSLKALENGFARAEQEKADKLRKEKQQKALASHSKAFTMLDEDEKAAIAAAEAAEVKPAKAEAPAPVREEPKAEQPKPVRPPPKSLLPKRRPPVPPLKSVRAAATAATAVPVRSRTLSRISLPSRKSPPRSLRRLLPPHRLRSLLKSPLKSPSSPSSPRSLFWARSLRALSAM